MNSRVSVTASHWGPGLAESSGGELLSVRAHPQDPHPSRINENIATSLRGSARVLKPSIRRSYLEGGPHARTRERGSEPFVEVSWNEALDLVATEVRRVGTQHGHESIYAGSYGWASAGRFHHAQSQLKRFLAAAGGFVRSEGNYSYNAALVLMPHIAGNFREHVKQATRWSTVARDGRLVVMFGGIPLRNVQVAGGGIARHRLQDDLEQCVAAGVRFVNFSPLRRDAAGFLNAEWIQPRPGSDTAIMMGLAHTLIEEGLHDEAFLRRYTVGFERLRAYLMGESDGTEKTASWAAAVSGVPADRLKSLAREMAGARTLITTAASLQRADHGEQPLWMTVALGAMLGQIGLPGGGYGIGYGSDATIGVVDRPLHWPSLPLGRNPVDRFIPVAMVADMLLAPGESYEYNGDTFQFPDIRLVWWAGGNPFHHHQDLNRLRRAFQKPETIIVNEINWTATARHADIVLPVAAPAERSDFGAGTHDNTLIPMPSAAAPPGEARIEYEIYRDLERRLELGTRFSEGRSTDEWLHKMWGDMRDMAQEAGVALPQWENFLEGDIIHFADPQPQAVFLEDFRRDPDRFPLPTPSGRLELASEVIGGFHYADCPGHPTWFAPRTYDPKLEHDFPLFLLSGQPESRLHSQYDNGSFSRSMKVHDREPVLIHPEDAASRGISDGDVVELYNDRGRCLAGAVVTDDIMPGVLFLWTGAWYDPDLDHPQHRDRHGNPNVLTHDFRTSRLAQGPAAQSARVQLVRHSDALPEVEAFRAPILKKK